MTRKHFQAIAAALAGSKPTAADFYDLAKVHQWEGTVAAVIAALDELCPNFNRSRFERACKQG